MNDLEAHYYRTGHADLLKLKDPSYIFSFSDLQMHLRLLIAAQAQRADREIKDMADEARRRIRAGVSIKAGHRPLCPYRCWCV